MWSKALTLLAILGCLGSIESAPTCTQIESMKSAILASIQSVPGLLPLMIRLGFHDCVGGCNGCINFNNADNNGLQLGVDTLTNLYITNNFASTGASKADFFALGAMLAVTCGVQISNNARNASCTRQSCTGPCPTPSFILKWGRKDVSDCSLTEPALPSPKMTSQQMYDYFYNTFGFNVDQTVALMGAHCMGGAKSSNSGYRGKWTGLNNQGFNELYYLNMINATNQWVNMNVAPRNTSAKWQYNGVLSDNSSAGFMLNTDFELFYDLTLDTNGKTTCSLQSTCGLTNTCSSVQGACQKATTFDLALAYSQSCPLFIKDFTPVYQAMLEAGSSDLETTTCP